MIEYEWDDAKSDKTLEDRGFGFDIMEGFDWRFALCTDIQHVENEERELWLGPISSTLYAVVTTERGRKTRIISLRRAERLEQRKWMKTYGNG